MDIVRRQAWLIAGCVGLGIAGAIVYWLNAAVWYESRARVLVNQRDPRLATAATESVGSSSDIINQDVLANHMEIVRSRRIVETALRNRNLDTLPTIVAELREDTDAADYVISHIRLTRGGEGRARDARSLTIAFQHRDPEDARLVLEAVVEEYQAFLGAQLQTATSAANRLICEARSDVEDEMKQAQEKYVELRTSAPVLFQGKGSSNIHFDQFRRLNDEMLELQIQESSLQTRLKRVEDVLASRAQGEESPEDELDLFALIDSESLNRLGVFVGLQTNSTRTAQNATKTDAALHENLTPDQLVKAYVGFLRHDLASIDERRAKLQILAAAAEDEAKSLVEYEMQDEILRGTIERKQKLYDGIVEQLRDLNLASGLGGYVHELLEAPRHGEKVWPKLSLCGIGGVFLGLIAGFLCAVGNDMLDHRFRSSLEIDREIGLPVLGRVGRLRHGSASVSEGIVASLLSIDGEPVRAIRTTLASRVKSGELKILATTSVLSRDGNSTVAASLATSFAQLKLDVLLIDADMRRPSVHELIGVPLEDGLSDVLEGSLSPGEAIRDTGIEHLSVLTAGAPPVHPSELLESERFDDMLESLSEQFRLILIDVGPVLAVSDPSVISQKAHATMLVIRPSNDTKDQVREAIRRLRSVDAALAGCVINTFGSNREFGPQGYGNYGAGYRDKADRKTVEKQARSVNTGSDGDPRLPASTSSGPLPPDNDVADSGG